jgi:hypothetical protein
MSGGNNHLAWIIALVAGLGCLGVLALGFGAYMILPGSGSTSVPVAAPVIAPASPAPAGWATYVHATPCDRNPELVLTHFTVNRPVGYQILPCQEQQPRPWGYVTFHRATPQGADQITVSYANGPISVDLLAGAADDLVRQLGAQPTRVLDTAPFVGRGASLLRRDSAFDVPQPLGPFTPGTYVLRQVTVPNPAGPQGLLVQVIAPAPSGEAAALGATSGPLSQLVESIRY